MDAARKSDRLFPAYTTSQLREILSGELPAETRTKMQGEVDRRDAGLSIPFRVPQIEAKRQAREIAQIRRQR